MTEQPLWKREPAVLISYVIGVIVGVGTFLTQLLASIGPDDNWAKVGLAAGALLIPLIQGRTTREAVVSPATHEREVFAMRSADK